MVTKAALLAQSSSIEDTVLPSVSNSPVRKPTVTLIGPQFRLSASTDPEGRFQFTALPPRHLQGRRQPRRFCRSSRPPTPPPSPGHPRRPRR